MLLLGNFLPFFARKIQITKGRKRMTNTQNFKERKIDVDSLIFIGKKGGDDDTRGMD
jgi:hypothetical protein